MKKILLIFSLVLLTGLSYSQNFKTVKIDSLISVKLPPIYTRKDTLGQSTFSARASYGFIVVTRIPNAANNTALKTQKDLIKVFKNYEKDVQQVGNGSIEKERDTTVGTLKGRLFTLRTGDESTTIQLRNFLFLYTKDATYTFQYFYDQLREELTTAEVKAFYSSIKVAPDLQRNDQYLSSKMGMSGGLKALLFGGGGAIVILIIVFVTIRRRRRKEA